MKINNFSHLPQINGTEERVLAGKFKPFETAEVSFHSDSMEEGIGTAHLIYAIGLVELEGGFNLVYSRYKEPLTCFAREVILDPIEHMEMYRPLKKCD